MATGTLEERVQKLENTVQEVQHVLAQQAVLAKPKRGWMWFVGIDANNPHFEDAVRFGKEWRDADRPANEESD
jgi:hypothetical protein